MERRNLMPDKRRPPRTGQTFERRVYLCWKSIKARYDYRRGEGVSVLYRVAQRMRIPVREVRDIIDAQERV